MSACESVDLQIDNVEVDNDEVDNEVVDEPVEFVELKDIPDYEILNKYPFTIRKKGNHYEVKESLVNGYPRISLNKKSYKKHILIAKQFLPNNDAEHKTQLDHINRRRDDYHLENLRWVSPSENCKNRTAAKNNIVYRYVDSIPDDAIVVNEYGTHQFEDYYYHDNTFYFFNGIQYRKLHINELKCNGAKYVLMHDINHKRVDVFYSKFKKLYDLI